MLRRLVLDKFKGFNHAELPLGRFTVLVGENASGKSNIREAFRFLHGLARGYTLAEIIGEKWGEGGVLQWKGLRGGTKEVGYLGSPTFSLTVELGIPDESLPIGIVSTVEYKITVDVGDSLKGPRAVQERLTWGHVTLFDSHSQAEPVDQLDQQHLSVRLHRMGQPGRYGPSETFISNQPVLTQIISRTRVQKGIREKARLVLQGLGTLRFLDLAPDAMRTPSIPGQMNLGDRGENLSSVLQAICATNEGRQSLKEWIKELTPMDAEDFTFPADQTGRILVSLVEAGGRQTSAYSASDGTLRFLAMIAAFLGPVAAGFYFFEELENGIHPNRLYLLLQLIEQRIQQENIQVVATSHSPQLLASLSESARKDAMLVYRLPHHADARIRRIYDIPEAARVLETQDLARLHAAGWLEDAVELTEDEVTSE